MVGLITSDSGAGKRNAPIHGYGSPQITTSRTAIVEICRNTNILPISNSLGPASASVSEIADRLLSGEPCMTIVDQLAALPTPALLVDERRMLANIARLRERAAGLGVRLRPHLKTAKSVDVARRLLDGGAGAATVSTLREAEVFFQAGVRDLLYAVGIEGLDDLNRLEADGGVGRLVRAVPPKPDRLMADVDPALDALSFKSQLTKRAEPISRSTRSACTCALFGAPRADGPTSVPHPPETQHRLAARGRDARRAEAPGTGKK